MEKRRKKRNIRALALAFALLMLLPLFSAAGFAEGPGELPEAESTAEPTAEPEAEPTAAPPPGDGTIPLIDQEEWWIFDEWDTLRPYYGARYGWLRLAMSTAQLEEVGHQYGGQACACYSLAYCRTLLDGRPHDIQEFNMGFGEADAYCNWTSGQYDIQYHYGVSDVYESMYRELCDGKPLAVLIKGGAAEHHYVAVVGFENVENGKALTADNFLIFDPCTESFEPENMGARGFAPKRLDIGFYQLLVDTSGESCRAEAHRSSYLSGCSFYGSCRLLIALRPAQLCSLPCDSAVDKDSETLDELKPGRLFMVDAVVKNRSGRLWYRGTTETGLTGYAPCECFTTGAPYEDGICAQEVELPPQLPAGESFTLTGRVVAARSPLCSVSVQVYAGGGDEGDRVLSAVRRGNFSFCRLEDGALADSLRFEALKPGDYCCVIRASVPGWYSADGKQLLRSERTVELSRLYFSVCESDALPAEG